MRSCSGGRDWKQKRCGNRGHTHTHTVHVFHVSTHSIHHGLRLHSNHRACMHFYADMQKTAAGSRTAHNMLLWL
jgi:hypothetical protein